MEMSLTFFRRKVCSCVSDCGMYYIYGPTGRAIRRKLLGREEARKRMREKHVLHEYDVDAYQRIHNLRLNPINEAQRVSESDIQVLQRMFGEAGVTLGNAAGELLVPQSGVGLASATTQIGADLRGVLEGQAGAAASLLSTTLTISGDVAGNAALGVSAGTAGGLISGHITAFRSRTAVDNGDKSALVLVDLGEKGTFIGVVKDVGEFTLNAVAAGALLATTGVVSPVGLPAGTWFRQACGWTEALARLAGKWMTKLKQPGAMAKMQRLEHSHGPRTQRLRGSMSHPEPSQPRLAVSADRRSTRQMTAQCPLPEQHLAHGDNGQSSGSSSSSSSPQHPGGEHPVPSGGSGSAPSHHASVGQRLVVGTSVHASASGQPGPEQPGPGHPKPRSRSGSISSSAGPGSRYRSSSTSTSKSGSSVAQSQPKLSNVPQGPQDSGMSCIFHGQCERASRKGKIPHGFSTCWPPTPTGGVFQRRTCVKMAR